MWMNLESVIHNEVKPEREKQILYINEYIWNPEKWYWWTFLQGKDKDTDVENELTEPREWGEGEGGPNWKSLTDIYILSSFQFLSHVWLFATPWIAARQASLSITNSQSSLKLMSIESVMPSSHLIFCRPLLFLPPIPPSIRVLSNESTLCMSWPKYWSFSFSISPSNQHPGLISFRMDWLYLLGPKDSQESSPTSQFKSINSSVLSFLHTLPCVK